MGRWFTVLGHSALLFGLAVVETGLSRTDGSARGPITAAAFTTEEQAAERNWHAFWNNHLGIWKGSWTRYIPEGDVKESFASTREFTANSAATEIVQNNRYRHEDGRSRPKQWSYNFTDSPTEHGQQLTFDSKTQGGSESDDENAFARYLRPHLGTVRQRIWLWRFGRMAADALRSTVADGPSTTSKRLQHALLKGRQFWCRLIQRSFRT